MGVRDPIDSLIGHGQLGLRSGLRTFDTLVTQSRSQKHCFVEIRGCKFAVPGDWSVHAGSIYKITTYEIWDSRRLDVVAVETVYPTREQLTRVESLADVVAGTYYVDPAPTTSTILYARLSDSSNPGSTQVKFHFGFYFGSTRTVQPALGPEKFDDGRLEVWTSSTELTNWSTPIGAGGFVASLNQDSTYVVEGYYSARLQGTFIPGGYVGVFANNASIPTVAGALYRYTGYYREDPTNPASISAGVGVTKHLVESVLADGRTYTPGLSVVPIAIAPAKGEWKRFVFDFIASGTATRVHIFIMSNTATAFGKVWFDRLSLRRIYRWELYEGRVAYENLPAINEGRNDIFFGRPFTGEGSISLKNGNDYFEELFGAYEIGNTLVYTRMGGRFPGGNEILADDQYVRRWTAREPSVSDDEARLDLDDPRQLLYTNLPTGRLNRTTYPDMAVADEGRTDALIYGSDLSPIKAPQTALVATSLYGSRRLADTTFGSVLPATTARTYVTEDSAQKELTALSTTFEPVTLDPATNLYNGRGAVDLVFVEAGKNDRLDFTEGGGALVGLVAPGCYLRGASGPGAGVYGANTISKVVEDALTLAGGTYTATYNDTTHKHHIAKSAGNWEIRLSTGGNRARSLWADLGFTADTDKTGANAYDSDTAMFTDPSTNEIVRFTSDGYQDDGSGTYTGTPSITIEKTGDIIYHILRKVLGEAVANIDTQTIGAVRSGAQALRVYLGCPGEGDGTHEVGQVFEWLGNSDGIEPVLDGDRWLLKKRDNTTPTNILDLYDRDFLEWDAWYTDEDLASQVVIEFGQNPATGEIKSLTVSETTSGYTLGTDVQLGRLRLGREKTKVFRTYLPDSTSTWIPKMVYNAMARRRRCRFTVKGSCFRKLEGDKVRIKRTSFLGRTDASTSMVVRVLNANHRPDYVSTIEAVEVLTGTYGW